MLTLAKKRIAILLYATDSVAPMSHGIVDHLARFWREDGHEVIYLFGIDTYVPADLILVHVNLSVVPDSYLTFAARYPIALNGHLKDIRKSVVSTNIVGRDDAWTGPVIVKSDFNFGGEPEKRLTPNWFDKHSRVARFARRVANRLTGTQQFKDWLNYKVFDRAEEVPRSFFDRQDLVVERFLPEIENGLFHLRMYQALGDRWSCIRIASPQPVFKAFMSVSSEPIEPHPEVEAWRKKFHLDYGKLDYLVHDGRPVLIDVNKTTGASDQFAGASLKEMRRRLAEGLYSYFA